MKRVFYLTLMLMTFATTTMAQTIPQELWGKWIIRRELPTSTISCWGESEARAIIGTEIEYTADSFRWQHEVRRVPTAHIAIVTAKQFHDENSGGGANSSQVSFRQLGIKAATARQVTIDHSPAKITDATTEIPGDVVLLKSRHTIVFSVCSVFFEANRVVASSYGNQDR
jgi:hypothetical protein